MQYDVAIIGAGPGGYVTAFHGAQLGLTVCLIEKAEVGGVCLNRGCIPTKTLAASAHAGALMKRAAEFGFDLGNVAVNWEQVTARKNSVVQRLVKGIYFLIEKRQIALIKGTAGFLSPQQLKVVEPDGAEQIISANAVIIASGSEPTVPAAFGYDGKLVMNSDDILQLSSLPASLIIVGGGVVGCEFASIFNAFGVQVTVIEWLDGLLPGLDRELGSTLRLQFKKRGITVEISSKVEQVEKLADGVKVTLANGKVFNAGRLLVAAGRKANLNISGLDSLGVETTPGGKIKVNDKLMTNIPGVYAIGDVNDRPWDLAHVASAQGKAVAEILVGKAKTWPAHAVPNCIFTDPEVASVGISLEEAGGLGLEADNAKFPFLANGKALADGEPVGFVKVIVEKATRRLLGVHIIGPHASDLIGEAGLAVGQGLTVDAVIDTIHAHPTLAEAFHEACEGIGGLSTHI